MFTGFKCKIVEWQVHRNLGFSLHDRAGTMVGRDTRDPEFVHVLGALVEDVDNNGDAGLDFLDVPLVEALEFFDQK